MIWLVEASNTWKKGDSSFSAGDVRTLFVSTKEKKKKKKKKEEKKEVGDGSILEI